MFRSVDRIDMVQDSDRWRVFGGSLKFSVFLDQVSVLQPVSDCAPWSYVIVLIRTSENVKEREEFVERQRKYAIWIDTEMEKRA
jgi:hypothetical protein